MKIAGKIVFIGLLILAVASSASADGISNPSPSPGGNAIPASVILAAATGINVNVTGDTAMTFTLPPGFTGYRGIVAYVFGATGSVSNAHVGLYTAPSQGGGQSHRTDATLRDNRRWL